jgi:hypothetical protein
VSEDDPFLNRVTYFSVSFFYFAAMHLLLHLGGRNAAVGKKQYCLHPVLYIKGYGGGFQKNG